MPFEIGYAKWLAQLLENRKGEGQRRLKEGHGHAERLFVQLVWWPAGGSQRIRTYQLNPEFKVPPLW